MIWKWKTLSMAGLATAAAAGMFVLSLHPDAKGQGAEGGVLGNLGASENEPATIESTDRSRDFGSKQQPAPGGPAAAATALQKPRLDWVQDPELDNLRMEVYRAELRVRFLKATAEIREYERRLSTKTAKETEAPKPAAPPKPKPKLKLIAVDGKGAIVEVDGRTYSFAKPGDQEGKVALKGISSDRVLVEVDGEDYEAKF